MPDEFQSNDRLSKLEKENQRLSKENKELWSMMEASKGKVPAQSKSSFFSLRQLVGTVFMGRRLKKSVRKLYDEIPENRVSKDTLAEVTTHLIWRLTRVGVVGLMVTVLPAALLIMQTLLMSRQNRLLNNQNEIQERVADRQNQLMDTQNKLLLAQIQQEESDDQEQEFAAMIDGIKRRVTSEINRSRSSRRKKELSDGLIKEIATLTQGMEPYQEVGTDTLTPYSKERGQVLFFLINREVNPTSLEKIYSLGEFAHADLPESQLEASHLRRAPLKSTNFRLAELRNADLQFAVLSGADLSGAFFTGCRLSRSDLSNVVAKGARFNKANMVGANFSFADLTGADFAEADLRAADFSQSNLSEANLEGAWVGSANWLDELEGQGIEGLDQLRDQFTVVGEVQKDDRDQPYYLIQKK